MPLSYTITKLFAGEALASRSERKRLEKKYSKAEEKLKTKTDVDFERCVPNTHTDRSRSSAIHPWHPDIGTSIKKEFSHDHLIPTSPRPPVWGAPTGAPDASARDPPDRSAMAHNPLVPPVAEMRGFGRHRICAGADEEFQMRHLHNTLSDVAPEFLTSAMNPDRAGVDQEVYDRFVRRRVRQYRLAKSRFRIAPHMVETVVTRTGKMIQRGFVPPYITPAPRVTVDDFMLEPGMSGRSNPIPIRVPSNAETRDYVLEEFAPGRPTVTPIEVPSVKVAQDIMVENPTRESIVAPVEILSATEAQDIMAETPASEAPTVAPIEIPSIAKPHDTMPVPTGSLKPTIAPIDVPSDAKVLLPKPVSTGPRKPLATLPDLPTISEISEPASALQETKGMTPPDVSPPQDLYVTREMDNDSASTKSDETIRPPSHQRRRRHRLLSAIFRK